VGDTQRPLQWFQQQSLTARVAWLLVALAGLLFVFSWGLGVFYDRDCKDFRTHGAAQRFYHFTGGPLLDFHNLDGDDDGDACERLP
jgi:hypothetical protein